MAKDVLLVNSVKFRACRQNKTQHMENCSTGSKTTKAIKLGETIIVPNLISFERQQKEKGRNRV